MEITIFYDILQPLSEKEENLHKTTTKNEKKKLLPILSNLLFYFSSFRVFTFQRNMM